MFLLRCLLAAVLFPGMVLAEEPKAEPARTADLAKKARPALVSIEPSGRDGEVAGVGTGFVISADGLIATNFHVIGEARPLRVTLPNGDRLEVTAVHAWSREKDLAILQVAAKGLPVLELGDSDKLEQGDYVAAMGNPLGLRYSVVEGVLSALQDVEGQQMFQVAMPVERGNSGGPLLDREGKVAGIVSMKSALTANLAFAVPSNEVKLLLKTASPVTMKNWLTIGALNKQLWKANGAQWTQRAGVIKVRGQNDYAFGGRAHCAWLEEPPALPYEVSVRVKLDDESGAAGLMFCSDGGDTHYGFYPTAGSLRLTRFEGPDVSSWTILEQVTSAAYHPGEWNALRVRVEDSRLLCYVNGELVITSSDVKLRKGLAGLCKFRQTEPDFREFRLRKEGAQADAVAEAVKVLIDASVRGETLSPEALDTLAAYPDATREIAEKEAATLEKRAAELRRQASTAHEQSVARDLKEILTRKEPQSGDLARAAFLIARLDNPDLDVDQALAGLDRMGADLEAFLSADDKSSPEKSLQALHRWMFMDNGFHGGLEDMNHRANSYLNEVIDDREGLPITLCLLHRVFAARIGLNVTGRNFQGRCLNHLQFPGDPPRDVYIDAFDRGKILSRDEALKLLTELNEEPPDEATWEPVSDTDVILRMLNNLSANASAAQDDVRLLRYLNTVLIIAPDAAMQRLQRLLLLARTGQKEKARADAAWLIAQEPPGMDTVRIFELLQTLKE